MEGIIKCPYCEHEFQSHMLCVDVECPACKKKFLGCYPNCKYPERKDLYYCPEVCPIQPDLIMYEDSNPF